MKSAKNEIQKEFEYKPEKVLSACYVIAPNDVNRNSRRGWIVVYDGLHQNLFFESGCQGDHALPKEIRQKVLEISIWVNIKAKEYKMFKKECLRRGDY